MSCTQMTNQKTTISVSKLERTHFRRLIVTLINQTTDPDRVEDQLNSIEGIRFV